MAPGPASVAHQLAAASLQPYLVHIRPGNALRRRARPGGHPAVRQLAPGAHRAHGHNIDLVDVRALPKIHIAVPAPRWRQGRAHAWPWPGSKRTAHQLAAAICRCTWCPPGQVVSQQRAGRRSVRIEQLARANVAGHGHNINLVDVGTAPRIHIAVPAPRRRQGKARMRVRPCPGPERAAHGRPPFAGAVTC